MTRNSTALPPEEEPLWKIVLQRLANPRTWIYPIIVLALAFFVLPRLAKQTPQPQQNGTNETILFGNPSETTDEDGTIHRFSSPATPSPSAPAEPSAEEQQANF